jgi:DNA-binding GntR family transcriptional regulator
MSRPAPVPRQNHASLISETLRDEILRGLLPPGKGLAEPRLAERFGVSRAPVREALLELSADGFLEFQPNGRTRILSLSERDFEEILDVRSALEGLAARRAAPGWTGEDSRTVRALIRRQAESQTLHELGELDVAMHAFIIQRSGNRRLSALWHRIRSQFSLWLAHTHRVLDALEAHPREESVTNHLHLLEALETRDPLTAAKAAQEHVEIWRQKLPAILPPRAQATSPAPPGSKKKSLPKLLLTAALAGCAATFMPLCNAAPPATQHTSPEGAPPAGADFFSQNILPILETHCFECHSHAHKIKGGLSLDFRSGWQKGGDSGPAVLPGNPTDSLLLRAVSHADKDLAMPPKKKLSPESIALLTEWVRSGAQDPRGDAPKKATDLEEGRKHWAFQRVSDPRPPGSRFPGISTGAIDCFLFEAQTREGLSPAAPTDRATLLRRATYDLTGLPPTAREIEAFLQDERPDPAAFSAVVERLLASPAYGEKSARLWLDLARFADTTGCSSDWPVDDAWRYRDWVVRAFNADLPLPQFLEMQIAGDLLARDFSRSTQASDPERIADYQIATGFLALSKRFGSNPNAFEHLTLADTLDNSWKALQGLSLGCARCHDHKFEPLFQKDYYALYGIFASSHYPYAGSELSQDAAVLVPLEGAGDSSALDYWTREIVAASDGKARTVLASSTTAWGFEEMERSEPIETRMPGSPWMVRGQPRVIRGSNSPFVHLLPAGAHAVDFPATVARTELVRRVRWKAPAGTSGSDPLLLAVDVEFSKLWNASQHRFTFAWRPAGDPAREVILARSAPDTAAGFLIPGGGLLPGTANQWHHLAVQCENPGAPLRVELWNSRGESVSKQIAAHADTRSLFEEGDIVLRFEASELNGKQDPCLRIDNVVASRKITAAPSVASAKPVQPGTDAQSTQKDLQAARAEKLKSLARSKPETAYAMWEGTPHDVALHKRGEPENAGTVVPRRNLTLFGGEPVRSPSLESGRRDLARWLTDDANPLTQRVYVNRIWMSHFGRGIVSSPNDFGHTGDPPSHPELLDYLVREFRKSGCSTKALHRKILLSHAYRQSAVPSPDAAQRDPDNRWLSHFSARRLTAEEIRDSVLSVSGLLQSDGPGHRQPFPPAESRNWSQHRPFSVDYERNPAPFQHHKRSLYLLTTRLVADPFLSTFDGADANQSTASRQQTTVAIQCLALMNAPVLVEAANQLATELQPLSEDTRALEELHRKIHGQPPSRDTLARLTSHFTSLLHAPQTSRKDALAVVAQSLLASNTFLYLR